MRRINKERMKGIQKNAIARDYYQKLTTYSSEIILEIADAIKKELEPSCGRNIAYGITVMAALESYRRECKEKALSQHDA